MFQAPTSPISLNERWAWTATGGALMLLGLRARLLPGLLLGLDGAWLIHTSLSGRPVPLSCSASAQSINLNQHVHVAAPLPKVYVFWQDFSHLPAVLPGLKSVGRDPEASVSHWRPTVGPAVEVEIAELHRDRGTAWCSRAGAAWAVTGNVTLRAASAGGTELHGPVPKTEGADMLQHGVQQQLVQQLD